MREEVTDSDIKIKNFYDFHKLQRLYAFMCDIPFPLYEDWIACCRDSIQRELATGKNTTTDLLSIAGASEAIDAFEKEYMEIREKNTEEKLPNIVLHFLRKALSMKDPKTVLMDMLYKTYAT